MKTKKFVGKWTVGMELHSSEEAKHVADKYCDYCVKDRLERDSCPAKDRQYCEKEKQELLNMFDAGER